MGSLIKDMQIIFIKPVSMEGRAIELKNEKMKRVFYAIGGLVLATGTGYITYKISKHYFNKVLDIQYQKLRELTEENERLKQQVKQLSLPEKKLPVAADILNKEPLILDKGANSES